MNTTEKSPYELNREKMLAMLATENSYASMLAFRSALNEKAQALVLAELKAALPCKTSFDVESEQVYNDEGGYYINYSGWAVGTDAESADGYSVQNDDVGDPEQFMYLAGFMGADCDHIEDKHPEPIPHHIESSIIYRLVRDINSGQSELPKHQQAALKAADVLANRLYDFMEEFGDGVYEIEPSNPNAIREHAKGLTEVLDLIKTRGKEAMAKEAS